MNGEDFGGFLPSHSSADCMGGVAYMPGLGPRIKNPHIYSVKFGTEEVVYNKGMCCALCTKPAAI